MGGFEGQKREEEISQISKMTYHDILRKHECLWRGSVTA